MANAGGVRQDKTRFIVGDLESTVGTFKFDPSSPTGSELRLPARGESRLMPQDGEMISNSEAIDGYAGAIAATRGAVGMGGTLATELRGNSATNVFPTHVKQLLASGFEASAYSNPALTLIPSTKTLTNWPGETGGTRSPASMSLAECLIDNNTADEWVGVRGAVLSTKINLSTNGLAIYESAVTGQVVNDLFLDVSDTDLSGFGAEPTGQGAIPAVVKGATMVIKYWDDNTHSSGTTITPAGVAELAIDLAPTVSRVVDPTATNGFTTAPVFYDGAVGVTLRFADSSDYSGSGLGAGTLMAGFKSGRGFLSVALTLTLAEFSTANQTIKFDLPCIQYSAERDAQDGGRAFSFTGEGSRRNRGSSTPVITVTYTHGTV